MTVVYVDAMLLVNGIINYLLLVATGRLAGVRLYRLRLLLGSLLGAGYSVAVYLPGWGFLGAFPVKLGVGVLMLLVAYGGERRLFRLALLFFAVAFAFGGGVLALGVLSGRGAAGGRDFLLATGVRELVLAAGFCYLVLSVVFRRSAGHGGSRGDVVAVRAVYEGRSETWNGLLDSGNTLSDPITQAPVIVVEWERLGRLLSPAQRALLTKERVASAAEGLEALGEAGAGRFRLIPYTAVGVSGGLLLALRPDAVYVGEAQCPGALLAFSPTPLSDGGGYAALVGDLGDLPGSGQKAMGKRLAAGAAGNHGKSRGGRV